MNWRRSKNNRIFFLALLFLLLLIGFPASAQQGETKGQIINQLNQQPVPFANIFFSGSKQGTISDINGIFTLPNPVRSLLIKTPGYNPLKIKTIDHISDPILVKITPVEQNTLRADSDNQKTARQLMQKAEQLHGPNGFNSAQNYQYIALNRYERLSASPKSDQPEKYQSEILYSQKRLYPAIATEEIINSSATGSPFSADSLLIGQLKNISLRDKALSILDRKVSSPLNTGDYSYSIEDTLLLSPSDTLFLLRFRPAENSPANGLQGFLQINSKNYAIEACYARFTDRSNNLSFILKQQYPAQSIQPGVPELSEAELTALIPNPVPNNPETKTEDQLNYKITVRNRTNIYPQGTGLPLSPGNLPNQPAHKENQQELNGQNPGDFLYQPLGEKDSVAIALIDSIQNASMQRKSRLLNKLSEGKIPTRYFDIDLNYLFGYNIYEGYKVGLGAETNQNISKYFSVGGYIIYGTRDKAIRHGEWLNIFPKGNANLKLSVGYRDMKMEFGEPEFLEKRSLFNPEHYRFLLVNNMYRAKRYFVSAEFRPLPQLNLRGFADLSDNSARSHQDQDFSFTSQTVSRVGLQLRYTPGVLPTEGSDTPPGAASPRSDWFLTLIRGLNLWGSESRYTKVEFKGKFNLPETKWGTTTLMLRGGKIFNDAPTTEWFNGYGSYPAALSIAAPYSFATMRMNEFTAQQFSALHLRHNFSPLLFTPGRKFSPELILAQNIGIGSHDGSVENQLPDFRKGFFETGIEANKLVRLNLLSLGLGSYYRYGPYRFHSAKNNFAWKVGIQFKL